MTRPGPCIAHDTITAPTIARMRSAAVLADPDVWTALIALRGELGDRELDELRAHEERLEVTALRRAPSA